MRVFVSAGEPSGDHHAALLVRAIRSQRPDAECVGLGGPCMAAEGCTLVADMTQLAVMWFLRVLLNIHRFVDLARRAERSFLDTRPDVFVMVDFPGFHWWLAWRAKRHGIPVVFYCPPQIWAWASWRRKKMRRLVDHVLSVLPFEHDWFLAQGIPSTLVGHPFFDELSDVVGPEYSGPRASARGLLVDDMGSRPHEPLLQEDAGASRRDAAEEHAAAPLVLLLPGSRGQEIEGNLDSILRAAAIVRDRGPAARFVIGALHQRHANRAREVLTAMQGELDGLNVAIEAGRTRSLIAEAHAAIAVSGSVSLELLAARVPTVIVYRISGLAYVVQSWFRRARFITLVNLLACREPIGPPQPVLRPPAGVPPADPEMVFPEYLSVADPAPVAADRVIEWLADPVARGRVVGRLEEIAHTVAHAGSADRAAAAVLAIAAGREPALEPTKRAVASTAAAA
jgi:lipid-A-disaccharide synthase